MDHILNYVTPAVIAAVVAAAMSISLPWVNWGIEKRRLQRQRKVEYIDAVRRFAQEHDPDLSALVLGCVETPAPREAFGQDGLQEASWLAWVHAARRWRGCCADEGSLTGFRV